MENRNFAPKQDMLKNIIIDLGNVIIPLNIDYTLNAFRQMGVSIENYETLPEFLQFETGEISTTEFLQHIIKQYPQITVQQFIQAWNAILLPIPSETIQALKSLKNNYRIFLLSNTNALHIEYIHNILQEKFALPDFTPLFEKVYYSFQYRLRKPDSRFFQLILTENNLNPEETLFIDDTQQHIETAGKLGLQVWHFIPGKDHLQAFPSYFNHLN